MARKIRVLLNSNVMSMMMMMMMHTTKRQTKRSDEVADDHGMQHEMKTINFAVVALYFLAEMQIQKLNYGLRCCHCWFRWNFRISKLKYASLVLAAAAAAVDSNRA